MIPVSWLSKYMYCPMQLYLELVKGIKLPKTGSMVKGIVVHRVLTNVLKQDPKMLQDSKSYYDKSIKIAESTIIRSASSLKKTQISLSELFERVEPLIASIAKERSKLAEAYSETFNIKGDQLSERVFPKFETGVFVESPGLRLRGEIDLMEIYPKAEIPVEIKTSRPPGSGAWDSDQLQLGAYLMLLESVGQRARFGIINYLGSKKVTIKLNVFLTREILKIRDEIEHMQATGGQPKVLRSKKCASCNMKQCPIINTDGGY